MKIKGQSDIQFLRSFFGSSVKIKHALAHTVCLSVSLSLSLSLAQIFIKLYFSESISGLVELFPILGHPYSNNGPAMPYIGIVHCPKISENGCLK